ncbi:MAG: prolyl oligopeptidase family serine peptidase [Candidatus Zixiibacteriota bacterium]
MARMRTMIILSLTLLILTPSLILAQESGYKVPPKAVADIVDAPWTPRISLCPDHEWLLLRQYPGYPSIEEVSQPELRLGGLRLNPATNGQSREWYLTELGLKKIADGSEYEISGLPDKRHIMHISFSPKGDLISFVNTADGKLTLWCISIKDRKAWQVSDLPLNGVFGDPTNWIDNKTLIIRALVPGRGAAPVKPLVPEGPTIRENLGEVAPARTYQDLLKNKFDEDVFTYYATSQLYTVTTDGKTEKIGSPALYTDDIPSPDGKYLLIESLHEPFSYTVPYDRFPLKTAIWDTKGKEIATIADLPLADNIPIPYGSVRTGRRSIGWRPDTPAMLSWAEARDDGDAGKEADIRDEVYLLDAPFTGTPVSLMTLPIRFDSVTWGDDNLAIVGGWWWKTRNIKAWRVAPGKPDAEPELLQDRSWEDRYNDPGRPLTERNKYGRYVLQTADNGRTLFMRGDGASPEGDRPFLRKFDLKSKETTELFRSEAPYYEDPQVLLDVDKLTMLTRRESVTEQPNYFIRDLKKKDLTQVTQFPHPTPQLQNVQKEVIRYERNDGVKLTGTLYLPEGYKKEDGPLPMVMWAYPQEYKDADAAGQMTDSPYRFVRVNWSSPIIWLAMGYAVLDDAAMPIVGEGDAEPNDTFREQLVANAQAAIDEVARRGVVDRNRVAVGGHSYGAFMTANLLAHSDLFKLGIARSGAYNRTLTPFGFQSEDRTLWEAPEIYFEMSPFMHAEKINEPLLMIHGEADNNSGTYPLQSERFYSALKGLGATVRLVMLPNESHGYTARESILHVLYETNNWLEKYVKNAPAESTTAESK